MTLASTPEEKPHSARTRSVPATTPKAAVLRKPETESAEAEAGPSFWTTHLSTKGQVVIPEQIRKDFDYRPGDEFVVVALNDLVFLKRI